MKIKYILLTIMISLLALPACGQVKSSTKSQTIQKTNDISTVLGKPIYEKTTDSLNTKVWIITQKENRNIEHTNVGKTMSKTKDKELAQDKSVTESISTGTHYFIYDVTNIRNGKEMADTSAKVEVVSPTKIRASVNLQPMMNHFGCGVSLTEKGDYLFTINLNVGMGYQTTQFKHTIK